jgi:methyltransferase (TIGR00027 family)
MDATSPSRTALATALMRARHARCDPLPVLHDRWGDRLVPDTVRTALASRAREAGVHGADDTALVDAWLAASPAYVNVIMRSRYTEDALQAGLERGIRQYVLVGAGLDSYALRLPAAGSELRVYELDHPATQSFKLRRLAQEGIALPPAARFVATDLAQESVGAALQRSDHDPRSPSFFSWLGVTVYLTREANLAALRAMSDCSPAGSELVFTYTDQEAFDRIDEPGFVRFREMQRQVSEIGEPYLCGFHPEELPSLLESVGFELVEDVGTARLLQRYDPDGRNGLRAGLHSRIARARVR